MAARNWDDEHVTRIEKLEEQLFRSDVREVSIEGDGVVTVTTSEGSEVVDGLSLPDEILQDFVNELLLPYAVKKPQPKKSSKKGNPAKRAAENAELGVGRESQSDKVRALTEVHDVDLNLPHSTDKGVSLRVLVHSVWPPRVPKAQIVMSKR